jgi:hypothetical protein
MAFDDLRISEYDLLRELFEAHTSGKYSSEFYVKSTEEKGWFIQLEGVNGNEDKELSGFTEGDLIGLSIKYYLMDIAKQSGHALSLSQQAFEQLYLSQAAAKIARKESLEAADDQTTVKDSLTHAGRLYDKAKGLIEDTQPLDQETARLIVELADDAIKDFGTTNHEKKVELRRWKAQAELVLPPSTIEELRKRAEGQLLKRSYPKKVVLRNAMLALVALGIVIFSLVALWRALSKSSGMTKADPSPSPIPAQSTEPALNLTPTPITTSSLEPKHIALSQAHNYRISENSDYVIVDNDYEILMHCKDIWIVGERVSLELRLPHAATNNLQAIDLPLGGATEFNLGKRFYSLTVDDIANDIKGADTARITMTRTRQPR